MKIILKNWIYWKYVDMEWIQVCVILRITVTSTHTHERRWGAREVRRHGIGVSLCRHKIDTSLLCY